jgi:hypothetical protein
MEALAYPGTRPTAAKLRRGLGWLGPRVAANDGL